MFWRVSKSNGINLLLCVCWEVGNGTSLLQNYKRCNSCLELGFLYVFIFHLLRALFPCYRVNPLELYLYYNFFMEAYIQAYIHSLFFSFLEMSLDYLLLHLLPLLTYSSLQLDSSYHIILLKIILWAHFTDPPLAAPSYALNNSLIFMGNPM